MTNPFDVLAITCGDIHLSHSPPLIRSAEPDWYVAMGRPLAQLSRLQQQYDCPVICAGDVFDKWNVPPELITFAIDNLPQLFMSVPGQHDLPYHGYEQRSKSAYGVMERFSERFENLDPTSVTDFCNGSKSRNLMIFAFPWNHQIVPCYVDPDPSYLRVAVIHQYVWRRGFGYPNAPKQQRVNAQREVLETYDVCVFGDNHKPFDMRLNDTLVYNCGGFMIRKADDSHRPSCGLLMSDGTIKRHYLDTSKDVMLSTANRDSTNVPIHEFVEQLKMLEANDELDFETAIKRRMEDATEDVKAVLQQVLHNC